MLICRFVTTQQDAPRYGRVTAQGIYPLKHLADQQAELLNARNTNAGAAQIAQLAYLAAQGDTPELWESSALPLERVRLLAPVTPSKIVCVGRNYRAHAAELGNAMPSEPLLFLKPPSSLIGPDETVILPPASTQVEHEGEIAVIIGRTATRLADNDDPLSYVLGYTCLNDVTARDIQRRDVQFTRGKSYDTFCPVGPYLALGLDHAALTVETRVNGARRQYGTASQMAFDIPYLVRYISHAMTLLPGDIIATGTPAGVGPLRDGDTVEIEVGGVGVLRHYIKALVSATSS